MDYEMVLQCQCISDQTMNLASLFVKERGLFMRFQTLLDVVKSYNSRFSLGLTDEEEQDLVEYLKSL